MRLVFAVLIACFASFVPARAEGLPDQRPILRIEPGMHTAAIKQLSLSADGRLLATGSDDRTARLWDMPTGKLIRVFRVPVGAGNEGKISATALSPDGQLLAAGGWDAYSGPNGQGNFVYLFNTATGALVGRLGPLPNVVLQLKFSPDGLWLAAGLGRQSGVALWLGQGGFAGAPLVDPNYGDDIHGLDFDRGGRLAVTSFDGRIRLYQTKASPSPQGRLLKTVKAPDGKKPFGIAFSPDGTRLAVGYLDTAAVSLLDAARLKRRRGEKVETAPIDNGDLFAVAWSADGKTLYGSGLFRANGLMQVIAWDGEGLGAPRALGGSLNTIMDLAGLPGGGVAWAGFDGDIGIFGPAGESGLHVKPVTADMREKRANHFLVAPNADAVWFGLQYASTNPWRFDVAKLSFEAAPDRPADFIGPNTDRLQVGGWFNDGQGTLNGEVLPVQPYEPSRSLAIAPGGQTFVLGAEWSIYRFDAQGRRLWRIVTPGVAWGVNLSADGAIVIAALGDGTIRWYRASDGAELLAFFVHAPDQRWVAWTQTGYYAASPGGEDLIGWHVNGKTWDEPVDFFPASRFRDRFYRPDIVQLVLQTRDEAKAVAGANEAAHRKMEDDLARKDLPPVVEIVADPRGIDAATPEIDVHYFLRAPSGREVTRIEARVNGQLVSEEKARSFVEITEGPDGSKTIRIPLPPRDAEISLVAFHGDQASAPAVAKVVWKGPPPPSATRRLFALLVGVSNYGNPDLKLTYADKDARDLAAALKMQEGRFFKSVETTLLLNGDAAENRIEAALAELAAKVGPDDYALVFMAGHGATLQNNFYFLPASVDVADGHLAASSLGGGVIARSLNAMKGKVLFFIDACYSARALTFDMSGFVNSVTGEENAVMMYSSSIGSEVSFEGPEWQNGAFTEALMAILADPASYNEEGEIDTDELAVALRKKVRKLTDNRQTPVGQASRAVPAFPVAGL
ncbi:hypothetical protein BH10PSE7_BH10PSE7_10190 [soil metagenome]